MNENCNDYLIRVLNGDDVKSVLFEALFDRTLTLEDFKNITNFTYNNSDGF